MELNNALGVSEDDDDDWDEEDFLGDDDWEDKVALQAIIDQLPNGWHLVKVINYTHDTLAQMEEWLADECRGTWEKVRWASGCSYSTGVQFEDFIDATLFKLAWT